jgi:uncharacterized protein (DUF983 family)
MRWEAHPVTPDAAFGSPPLGTAVLRGLRNRCPACGEGQVFQGYLRVVPRCASCAAPLGALRADDAPPYFTIFIVGKLLLPLALLVEKAWMPPMWLHMVLWLPLFAILCTLALRPIKGAVVGWMASLGLTGEEHGPALPVAAPPPGADRGRPGA